MSSQFFIEDKDIPFEEELLRNGFAVKSWLRYLEHKQQAPKPVRFRIYERALKNMPGSYKLWYKYLMERKRYALQFSPSSSERESCHQCFERCLAFLHKMPRIWIEYLDLLKDSGQITRIRRQFDEALRSLAITQHYRIWPMFLEFVQNCGVPETAVRVYRRYLLVEPDDVEEYVKYLKQTSKYDEAANKLVEVLNRDKYASKSGKTEHQLWQELCDIVGKHPEQILSLNVEAIIRSGISKFSDLVGTLWCSLANYYIRRGNMEKARDVYEEGLETVMTVRDFTQIFEAYAEFEEQTLSVLMEQAATDSEDANIDLEMRMARYERLMDRRPLLLSSVLLRQNPHNVEEWHKRVALFEGDPAKMIQTYTEAVQTVDPDKATGKPHTLWVEFAKLYEQNKQPEQARQVFERAIEVPYKRVEELAALWCEYVEMELRLKAYQGARKLLQRATAVPSKSQQEKYRDALGKPLVQLKVYRSIKLWAMYADIEESIGTFESTKAVYNRIMELRVATPQIVLNYGTFLEEKHYFEEAFAVYERGVALFTWPAVYEIWNAYLVKFTKRYAGKKIERARELFEQAVEKIPERYAKPIFLLYAKFEEEYGMARHAMAVYERATQAVQAEERFEVWQLYIKRAAALFGVTHTRPLYAKALEDEGLSDKEVRTMSLQFAQLEAKLGEIDRARAVYAHASQWADPRSCQTFWKTWHDFEVRHGNEDTFRDMLRIKRSVAAQHNTAANVAVFTAATEGKLQEGDDDMAALDAKAKSKVPGFVPSSEQQKKKAEEAKSGRAPVEANKAEIDIGDIDDDEDEDDEDDDDEDAKEKVEISEKNVPDAVFGGVLGAKERFAKAQQSS